MIEGATFVVGILCLDYVNKIKRNQGKMCLFGLIFYLIGNFLGGPLFQIERSQGVTFFVTSLVFNGLG